MKYLKQFLIIILISFIGEILKYLIPLAIPASIYGMILMLLALSTGVLKLHQVKEAGEFMIEIMPVMFIPAAVGLLDSWSILKPMLIPVSIITVMTTIVVMVVSGLVTQFVVGKESED